MSLTPYLAGLVIFALLCALVALANATRARSYWRRRRRLAATHRALWSVIFVLLGGIGALCALALLGYRRLGAEAAVARIDARALGPQRFAVTVTTPDGKTRDMELSGDDWQLDARVIKWDTRAVVLGAPPLYQLDRISGRYRDVAAEREMPRSVVALDSGAVFDLWHLKQRFPQWVPWVDADYGSAAYLPLLDGGHYTVTLAAAGGLVARGADPTTVGRLGEINP